jgi:hypothetical protein
MMAHRLAAGPGTLWVRRCLPAGPGTPRVRRSAERHP